MTADEVLDVLIDAWRQGERIDAGTVARVPVNRNISVERLCELLGLRRWQHDWHDAAELLMDLFAIDEHFEVWETVLAPRKRKPKKTPPRKGGKRPAVAARKAAQKADKAESAARAAKKKAKKKLKKKISKKPGGKQ